jgi:predicted phage terminase large subunit-like protein
MSDFVLDLSLHPAQLAVFQNPARFNVLAAGRRFGKSDLAIKRAVTKALSPLNVRKKPVWIIAPTHPQAKAIYWDPLNSLLHPITRRVSSNEGLIWLNTGVQVAVKGADSPDSLRGEGLYDVTLDEFADMKPQTWETIIRPALADVKGTGLFIGTPKGRNHFYTTAMRAKSGEAGPDWAYHHYTSFDNPYLDPAEIEHARQTMSSSAFRQEFMASFETGGSDLFQLDWLKYDETEPKDGEWYVVVDLAGFAGIEKAANLREARLDQHAIAIVKIHGGEKNTTPKWWVKKIVTGRWGVRETARKIIDAVEGVKALNLGIEKGALYNAVAPDLMAEAARRGIAIRPEPLSHENANKNDRVTWALQGRFEHGHITLCPGDWTAEFEDQYLHFPSKLVHDDMMDALAFIVQLAKAHVFAGWAEQSDDTYWEPLDRVAAF